DPLLIFAGAKILLTLCSWISLWLSSSSEVSAGFLFADIWKKWDANWYLLIAREGYLSQKFSAAFFPVFPALIAFLQRVLGVEALEAALLISHLSFLGALYLFQELTEMEFGPENRRRSLLLISFFPGSLFLMLPYTESLF